MVVHYSEELLGRIKKKIEEAHAFLMSSYVALPPQLSQQLRHQSYFSMNQGKGWSQIRRQQKKCGPLPIDSFSPCWGQLRIAISALSGELEGGGGGDHPHPGVSHTLCDVLCCV